MVTTIHQTRGRRVNKISVNEAAMMLGLGPNTIRDMMLEDHIARRDYPDSPPQFPFGQLYKGIKGNGLYVIDGDGVRMFRDRWLEDQQKAIDSGQLGRREQA